MSRAIPLTLAKRSQNYEKQEALRVNGSASCTLDRWINERKCYTSKQLRRMSKKLNSKDAPF